MNSIEHCLQRICQFRNIHSKLSSTDKQNNILFHFVWEPRASQSLYLLLIDLSTWYICDYWYQACYCGFYSIVHHVIFTLINFRISNLATKPHFKWSVVYVYVYTTLHNPLNNMTHIDNFCLFHKLNKSIPWYYEIHLDCDLIKLARIMNADCYESKAINLPPSHVFLNELCSLRQYSINSVFVWLVYER